MTVDRRTFLFASAGSIAGMSAGVARADPRALLAGARGGFAWKPDGAPEGPLLVLASIVERRVTVYRAGVAIGVSRCQLAARDWRPGTIVSYLEVPDAIASRNALSWRGMTVFRSGALPRMGAIVSLPPDFARRLAGVTGDGAAFIVTQAHTTPATLLHGGVLLASATPADKRLVLQTVARADPSHAPAAVLFSLADRRCYVLRDGAVTASMPIGIRNPSQPLGTHAFVLAGPSDDALRWLGIGLSGARSGPPIAQRTGRATLDRLELAVPEDAVALARHFSLGTMLITTDASASTVVPEGRASLTVATVAGPAASAEAPRPRRPRPETAASQSASNLWSDDLDPLFRPY